MSAGARRRRLPRTDIEASAGTLRQPGEVFVGRKALLEAMRNAFVRGRVAVADMWGLPGSGRSALIAHAKTTLAAPGDLVLRYRFATEDQVSADADARAVTDYAAFRVFADQVARDLKLVLEPSSDSREQRLFEDFDLAFDQAHIPIGPITNDTKVLFAFIKDSNIGNVDVAALHASVRDKRPGLAAALATLLRGVTQETPSDAPRLLLALDEFDRVPTGPLRTWVLELVKDLDSALVVVPRLPNAAPPDRAVDIPLGRLSRDEIREFAELCLPMHELSDWLIVRIDEATDGHPQAVCLAMELLQRFEAPEAAAAAAELGRLPPDIAERRAHMVERILGRDGREAEQLLRDCAVMRKFDAAMLARVVGPEADLDRLRRYSFVEEAADARDGFFRLHPSVRRELAHQLEKLDRERFLRLHRLAAEQCAEWISEYEEEEDVDPSSLSYGSWYRYEDPSWQAAKREWLYHQTRASPSGKDERELGRLRFTRVFLDAFWWWGCYVDFPFCQALLEDWRMTQADQDWTTAFTQLLDAYPPGYEKEKEAHDWREDELPRWEAVRAALLEVREACGLNGDPRALEDPERRHTRALIDNFLAHAARYQSSDEAAYSAAVARYDEAVVLFEADDDDWDTAWTRFERSELHLEHGRVDEARADWKRVAELVPVLEDEELAANLHRLAADAHLRAGDVHAAFAAHGRAVLHAYLFQRRPHPPDEYTLAFYAEQVARALERLVEHASGGGDAARAAELLAAPFPGRPGLPSAADVEALCLKPDLQTLSAALFPDPPRVEELHRRSSQFLQRWVIAESALDLEVPTDLTGSAW